MVKKIGGKSPVGGTPQSSPIQSTKTVAGAKVSSVGEVQRAEGQQRIANTQGFSGKITPEQRAQIYQMIEEEAEKMFASNSMPEHKKQSIKGAVRMVIDGGALPEEDEEK